MVGAHGNPSSAKKFTHAREDTSTPSEISVRRDTNLMGFNTPGIMHCVRNDTNDKKICKQYWTAIREAFDSLVYGSLERRCSRVIVAMLLDADQLRSGQQ